MIHESAVTPSRSGSVLELRWKVRQERRFLFAVFWGGRFKEALMPMMSPGGYGNRGVTQEALVVRRLAEPNVSGKGNAW